MNTQSPKLRSNFRADNFMNAEGDHYVVVTDALIQGNDFSRKLKIPSTFWQIAVMMNGQNQLTDIRQTVESSPWGDLPRDAVSRVYQQLDEWYLLENQRYYKKLEEVERELDAQPCRRTQVHDDLFPAERSRLLEQVNIALHSSHGPGDIENYRSELGFPVRGLVVPHAHYAVSGACAGYGYREVAAMDPAPDLIVVVGYNHLYSRNQIETLIKDIESPLGRMSVDRDVAEELVDRSGILLRSGGVANYREHSIDMQIPMVQYALQSASSQPGFLPIILSNVPVQSDLIAALRFREDITAVAGHLRDIAKSQHKRMLVIASGDFTHQGTYYGDDAVDHHAAEQAREFDKRAIELITQRKKDDFYRMALTTKYCCVTPVYFMLSCLAPSGESRLLSYYSTWDIGRVGDNLNSFAAIALS